MTKKHTEYLKEWTKKRLEMGICPRCGKNPPEEGRKSCSSCLEKGRECYNAWRSDKIANNLCGRCGEGKLEHYPTMCDSCAIKERKRVRKRMGHKPSNAGGRGRPCVVPE